MNPGAAILGGVPPWGLGLYARDTIETGPFRFIALNAHRGDLAAQVAEVRARGAQLWLYSTPENWRPDAWAAELARIVELARVHGAVGIIADPEGGWTGEMPAGAGSRDDVAAALGTALAAASDSTRVCVTSYPSWPGLDALARAAGRRVSASIQIYGRTTQDAEEWARWYAGWRSRFGSRLCLSIAGWPADDSMDSAAGYASYLARLPKSGGAIVWDAAGAAPTYIQEGLASYQPGGTLLGTLTHACRAMLAAPGALVTLGTVVAIVAIVAIGAKA